MSSPPESQPSGMLLLREIPALPGGWASAMFGMVLAETLAEVSVARCRLYVLVDLVRPAADPPVAGALVEMGPPAREARLRALSVDRAHRGRGLDRRLLGDLLTELRADGVQRVRYRVVGTDTAVCTLLRSAGFVLEDENPAVTCRYDGAAIEAPAVAWLMREL
ncbi:hypothetical protein GCM10010517_26920 [Streptosporangium fragile]|uniref:N-acetyltransferase domain-containing protein n=1 Tax=Streptosporangium fragile TaxID=46186 RepID=A0ABN3VVE6_9ACTN